MRCFSPCGIVLVGLLVVACSDQPRESTLANGAGAGTAVLGSPVGVRSDRDRPKPPAQQRAIDPASIEAARGVVMRYYALLAARDYAAAYRLWVDDGRASGQTATAFAAGFADTAHTEVSARPASYGDAGMGHVYATVPVVVDAVLKDGTRQRFAGSYTLSRVNDVDGSTAEQRRWHLMSADLRPKPVPGAGSSG